MKPFLAALVLALVLPVHAQERFPDKPVRFIVPFPPGGGTDGLARILGAKLAEIWGQQVLVENRAGAQGNIGTAAGAKAPADGYTITLAHQGALVINPHLYGGNIGYDPLKDFAAVARATEMAFILVVHPSLPATSMKELAELARKHPGKLAFASTSAGPQMAGELFRIVTGTQMLHIPYKGAGPATTDLLAGHVSIVPSALEAGYPELSNVIEWYGVVVPAATPRERVAALSAAVHQALSSPDAAGRIQALGQTLSPTGPEEFDRFIRAEYERWGRVVKTSGAKAD